MKCFNFLGPALLFAHLATSQTSTTTYTFTTKITTTITVNPIQTTSIINSNVCPEASPTIASLESSIAILRSSLNSIFGLCGPTIFSVSASPTSGLEVSRPPVFGRTVITPLSNMSTSATASNPVSMCSVASNKISTLQASIALLGSSINYALNLSIPFGGGLSISPSSSASSLPILLGDGISILSSNPVAAFITPAPTILHRRANFTSSFNDHPMAVITDTVYSTTIIDLYATTCTTASETPIPPTLGVQDLANATPPKPTRSNSKPDARLTQSELPSSPTLQKSFAGKNIPDWWLILALIGLMAFTTLALEPLTARQNIVPSGSPQPPAFLPPASTCSDNNSYICQLIGGHFTVTISTVGVPEGTSLPSTFFPFTPSMISTTQEASSTSQGNLLPTLSSSRTISQPTTSITLSEQAYLSTPESALPSTFHSEQTILATGTFSTGHSPVTSVIMTTTTLPPSQASDSASAQLSTVITATQESVAIRSIATPLFLLAIIDLATAVYTTSTSWLIVSEYSGFRNISVSKPSSAFTVPNSLSSLLKVSTPQLPLTITPIASILSTDAVESGSFPTEIEPPDTSTFSTSRGPKTSVIISTTTLNSTSEQPKSNVAATQQSQALRKLPNPVWLLVVCGVATAVIQVRFRKDGKKVKVEQTDKINEREFMETGE